MSIIDLFKQKENNAYPFKPNNSFYRELGISKKRFAIISKDRKSATYDELNRISQFLGVPIAKIIE